MAFDQFEVDPLPVTVPLALHEAMSRGVSPEFAVSYLCGAVLFDDTLHPRTETARKKLKDTGAAMLVLSDAKVKLGDAIPPDDRMLIAAVEVCRRDADRRGRK